MSKQIQATVYSINGSPLSSAITLSFPTANILVKESTNSTISQVASEIWWYNVTNNQLQYTKFEVSESVSALGTDAGGDMFAATILQINGEPVNSGLDFLFPSIQPQIGEASDDIQTEINSVITFKGSNYYVEEEADDLVAAANVGIEGAVGSPIDVSFLWAGSQAQYDAIVTPDANTLYFIV